MSKILYNFYIEEDDKKALMELLEKESQGASKGMMSSFMRVCVKKYLAGEVPEEWKQEVRNEYAAANEASKIQ